MPLDRLSQITEVGIKSGITLTNTNVVGVITATRLSVSEGFTVTGVVTATNFGSVNANTLNVSGVSTFNANIFLGDGDIAYFGDGQDLLIWHNSTDSIIRDNGTGDLNIEGGNRIKLTNPTGIETYAVFNQDGASELWYDNVKRLETSGIGVSITSALTVGTGASISSPSSNTLTLGTNNTEAVRISSTGSVGINTNNPGRALHIQGNGSVEQIWEQGDGKANTKKYNLVVDGGNASTTPNIYLRYLNDSYAGGNYVWAYNGSSQIHQIYSNGNQIATVNGSGINVTGIVTASTAINAPGSVVQTIWKNLGSTPFSATSTSSSYRATGFTNTITPKFSTSRIFHIVTIGCQFICDGQIVIYRNGSQSSGSLMDSYRDGITASYTNDMPAYTFTYLDTTPSSSTLNYELYCRATGCGGVMFVGSSGDFDASWTIMEIAN